MDNTTLDLVFPAVGGREVVSRNDGGDITSDAGLLLVSLADKKLGLTAAMADAITDDRDQNKVLHGILEMARERIYAICQDYEDTNDLDFGCGTLLSAATIARGDGGYSSFLTRLEKTDLLVIDDWGMYPLDSDAARDIFEILEDRAHRGSTLIVSQVPIENWYDIIAAPTIADAILNRLVHNAYKIEMTGESTRKKLSPLTETND
ncbi:MAG: ATP-binding protein [Armatimonadetes bacterium]|nr:ATP-binding protein [Armatimonadota bacterium]